MPLDTDDEDGFNDEDENEQEIDDEITDAFQNMQEVELGEEGDEVRYVSCA
jgi:hypothetical protein